MLKVRYILAVLILISFCLFINKLAYADDPVIAGVSWPNCNEKFTDLTFSGIVGVNDGLDFSSNPCLGSEVQLFHNSYALYLNTGYPGKSYGLKYEDYPNKCRSSNLNCLAYNYGYNDVLYSVRYANLANAHSYVWWLDIESDNSWTNSYKQNRQTLIGMVDALKKTTFRSVIGFYSYPDQWKSITNNWKPNYPVWVASATASESLAKGYCVATFSNAPVWLSQYTTNLDYNYNCSPKMINNFKIKSL